jgi:hypothetical protein
MLRFIIPSPPEEVLVTAAVIAREPDCVGSASPGCISCSCRYARDRVVSPGNRGRIRAVPWC